MLAAALLPLVLAQQAAQAPQGDTWIPGHRIEIDSLAEARTIATAGDHIAFVRVLPLPPRERRKHVPRPPWQLVRMKQGDAAAELVADAESAYDSWGPPSFLAVEADGTVVASWRPGHRILFAAKGAAAVEFTVHDESALWCAALSTRWILHLDTSTRELTARPLTPAGVGEPFRVAGDGPTRADDLVFDPPWLAWVEGDRIVAVDVRRRERRNVAVSTANLVIDGVWNGHLFAHDRNAHVVELESGVVHSLSAPQNRAVVAAVPEGVLTYGWLWDPVAARATRLQFTPFWDVQKLLRRAPGVLWIQDDGKVWHELRLAEPVAMPEDARRIQAPGFPQPQPGGDDAKRALRAAWRAACGG